MAYTQKDLNNIKNLIIAMGKATFKELETTEVLALAQCMEWLGSLRMTIDTDVKAQIQAEQLAKVLASAPPASPMHAPEEERLGQSGLMDSPPKPKRRKNKKNPEAPKEESTNGTNL